MKALLMVMALATAGYVHADEKTCAVQGMHCQGCTEMVEGKVCGDGKKFAKCEVKLIDEGKELGQVHLITKTDKVDEKWLNATLKDAGYDLGKCEAGAPKAPGKKTAAAKGA